MVRQPLEDRLAAGLAIDISQKAKSECQGFSSKRARRPFDKVSIL